MAETKLIPGFRFHPTDVELVKYFLKRKVTGRKFPFDVIAEIDIYKYAPWDLPDKSLLNSGDLEWYFFSPRREKYSTGGRMNRATEIGYWKTTGKDRSIEHKNQVVGMIRTLVFHLGKAPKGNRTDWVMHEFRLEDKDLADKGIPQDSYVICRVFQKEGPGPRNGAQYGKPFDEKDWDSGGENDCVQSIPVAAMSAPVLMLPSASSVVNDMHPSTSECNGLTSISCLSIPVAAMSAPVLMLPSASHISVVNDMHASTSECNGLTSISCLSGMMPFSSTHPLAPSNQPDDDILSLLDCFKEEDDNTLDGNENNEIEKVGIPGQANNAEGAPYLDPNEIFNDLGDLGSLVGLDGFSSWERNEYTSNELLSMEDVSLFYNPQEQDFLELVDLEGPLFGQTLNNMEVGGQDQQG